MGAHTDGSRNTVAFSVTHSAGTQKTAALHSYTPKSPKAGAPEHHATAAPEPPWRLHAPRTGLHGTTPALRERALEEGSSPLE